MLRPILQTHTGSRSRIMAATMFVATACTQTCLLTNETAKEAKGKHKQPRGTVKQAPVLELTKDACPREGASKHTALLQPALYCEATRSSCLVSAAQRKAAERIYCSPPEIQACRCRQEFASHK